MVARCAARKLSAARYNRAPYEPLATEVQNPVAGAICSVTGSLGLPLLAAGTALIQRPEFATDQRREVHHNDQAAAGMQGMEPVVRLRSSAVLQAESKEPRARRL